MADRKLTVLIIGGGIGGLVAAIALAQRDNEVTVIEHKARYGEDGGANGQGLSLTANATKCLFNLGLEEDFEGISDVGQDLQMRSYHDGASIRRVRTLNGHSMVHRTDLLRILVKHATKADAKIHINQSFLGMIEHESGVGVMLQDGRCLQVDVVIGADGIHSQTRASIDELKDLKPVLTGHCTFLVDVPKSTMEKNELTRQLYEDGKDPSQFWLGSQRSIIGWTMTRHDRYHLQMNDHVYGDGAAYGKDVAEGKDLIDTVDDMAAFRKRWNGREPAITILLEEITSVTKWRIAELPHLPRWSSPGGRIILIGDAAHAVPPYAGQGAAMAIEDATVLATLLSRSSSFPQFGGVAKAYEKLRRPRFDGFREIIHANMERWNRTDADRQAAAQHEIADGGSSKSESTDSKGLWTSEQRYRWTDEYDATREALDFVAGLQRR